MRRSRALPLVLLLALASPARAQTTVTSAGPDNVDVTIYRAPNRSADSAMDLEWLYGYALISETRTVTIPAGESDIRFEGVAGGIVPQSAIITGLPEGVIERNRDAYLLSPESLYDRSLGRRVHLRRTSLETGAVREQDAVIRSGADGAVVVETPDGVEALRCTGLPEQLVYNEVPAGLAARPTLSVRARSREPVTATVTLSYLAEGFDWQANYIAELSADGSHVSLFAWLTLANGDETSFRNADTQAVAGRLNRQQTDREEPEPGNLAISCWPQGRTSDIPLEQLQRAVRQRGTTRSEDLVNNLPQAFGGDENVVVTGSRIRAVQEALGDLKLYRIPEPVTVSAHSQKQVAFLEQPAVAVTTLYRARIDPGSQEDEGTVHRLLITRNRTAEGLGLPLPAGGVQLFASAGGDRRILLGEGTIDDHAVGEDVEIDVGETPGVMWRVEEAEEEGDDWQDYRLIVTNDQPRPIRFEAVIDVQGSYEFRPRGHLGRRFGKPLWALEIPANGSATLRYRMVEIDDDDETES